jgi:hypothetical protein
VARQTALAAEPRYGQHPAAFALPGRALLSPTPAEAAALEPLLSSPEAQAQVQSLALPVINALRPARREQVTVGTLLIRGR